MNDMKHTPGPWRAEVAKGYGRAWCIQADRSRPLFQAVKPKEYFTDYPPSPRDPDYIVLSDDAAREAGRYVATPEICAAIDAEEAANALLAAAAPDMLEALQEVPDTTTMAGAAAYPEWLEKRRAAIAKATGGQP